MTARTIKCMPNWTVEGADRSTGVNISETVDLPTEDEARTWAERQGIVVSDIRVSRGGSAPAPDAIRYDPLRTIEDDVRSIAGWVRFIGILILLSLIAAFVRVIVLWLEAGK